MQALAAAAIGVATFLGMEAVAFLMHRHLMHGPLWFLHESHHRPRRGLLEWNDLFGLFFAVPSMVLIHLGTHGRPFALAVGLGMTAYGAAYFGFHDVIVGAYNQGAAYVFARTGTAWSQQAFTAACARATFRATPISSGSCARTSCTTAR
jgi:hypothetical protein